MEEELELLEVLHDSPDLSCAQEAEEREEAVAYAANLPNRRLVHHRPAHPTV